MSSNSSFYDFALQNSNVVDINQIKENIQNNHPEFDNNEFSKDIREINFNSLVNGLDFSKINAKYEIPEQKGSKSKSTGIQSFQLKSGDIFGIGNRPFQSSLMIKGIKSFFPQHPYKFGDDEQKALLKKPLNELMLFRQNMSYSDFKKLMTFQISFQVFSQEKLYQSEDVIEQFKYLMLIKEVIGKLVKDDTSIKSIPNYKVNGFIQEKYNDFCKEDITNLTVNVEIVPKFGEGLLPQSVILYYNDVDGNPICNTLIEGNKTIEQVMNSVQMKPMDIVLYLDNCSTKKIGKEVTLMPKIQAVNVVLTKSNEDAKPRGHGLNLQKFQQIINKSE